MKNNQSLPSVNKSQIRFIEAEAYRNGYENVPIDDSLAETAADFAQMQQRVGRESADAVKDLEGKRAVAAHRRADGETRWQMWRETTNGIVPPLAAPLGRIWAAFAAMAGEAVLLAPLMDLFGVADQTFQFVLASVIVVVLALLIELPIHLRRINFNRYAVCAVAATVGFGLIALGVFRAFGLQAIEAKNSVLIGGFLDENSILSAIVIAFLTVGLPVGAAFAFETGWHGLSRWRQWRKARRDWLKYAKRHETIVKKLAAETEKRDLKIAELDRQCQAWLAAKRQAHGEGLRSTARRKPFWEIAFLLFGGCLLIAVLTLAFAYIFCDENLAAVVESDLGRFALYFGFALGLMSIFAFYVLKRWNSPTAAQLYDERTVAWRGEQSPAPFENGKYELTENAAPKIAETVEANGKFA